MSTDLTGPSAVARTTPPSPSETDALLYISEEFAELLDSITAARARWDADSKGTRTRETAAEPSIRPDPTVPTFASWTLLPAASKA